MNLASSRQSCLPEDLIVEIIRRLPVKHILRVRCVNKSWYRFIGSSSFIKSTIRNTNINQDNYLLCTHTNYYTLTDLSEDECTDNINKVKYYYIPPLFGVNKKDYPYNHKVKVYGVCNGLLCVSDYKLYITSSIYLWNPVIRKAKRISMIPPVRGEVLQPDGHDPDLCLGYYCDDYKVVKIACFCGGKYRVGVYSLSTDAWKITYCGNDSDTYFLIGNPSSNKFVAGVAYFGVAHFTEFKCKLLCFDLYHERIRDVQFPDKFSSQLDPYSLEPLDPFSVEPCGESIALIQVRQGHLTKWVLRKCATTNTSTWENVVRVELETHNYLYPLGFTENGKYLLRDSVGQGSVYLWDFGISQLEQCTSDMETKYLCVIDSLVGNLVLLKEQTLDTLVEMKPYSTQNTFISFKLPLLRNKKRTDMLDTTQNKRTDAGYNTEQNARKEDKQETRTDKNGETKE